MLNVERGQKVRQVDGGAGDDHADGDATVNQPGQVFDSEPHAGDGFEGGAGEWQDGRADLGEADGAAGAVQQWLAKLALKLADLRADAGLRDAHAGGGARE